MGIAGFSPLRMRRRSMHRLRLPSAMCLMGLCAIASLTQRAAFDAVSDFYRGKTVTIIVGYTAGARRLRRKAVCLVGWAKAKAQPLTQMRDSRAPCPPSASMRDTASLVGTAYERFS